MDKIISDYNKRKNRKKTFSDIFNISHSPFSHLTIECNKEIRDGNRRFYSDKPLDFNIQYQILIRF